MSITAYRSSSLFSPGQAPAYGEVQKLKVTLLDTAIERGAKNLAAIQDPTQGGRPYFFGQLFGHAKMKSLGDPAAGSAPTSSLNFDRHFLSNVAGRALFALGDAERVSGARVPLAAVEAYVRLVLKSVHDSGGRLVGIPADPESNTAAAFTMTYLFNQGAGLRGLVALATLAPGATVSGYSGKTEDFVSRAIGNLTQYFVNAGFNWETFRRQFNLKGGNTIDANLAKEITADWTALYRGWSDPFCVYALMRYHQATASAAALELARKLKDHVFENRFPADLNKVPTDTFDHLFEPCAEMNAYARLATVDGDVEAMSRIRARFQAMRRVGQIAPTGWVAESAKRQSDVGEPNNSGEVIETCLSLAAFGWPEYYEIAERFIRNYLLKTQVIDSTLVESDGAGDRDGTKNLRTRFLGGFAFAAPYGLVATKSPYFTGIVAGDCTAGGVASLCEIKRHVLRTVQGVPHLNFLFDVESEKLTFKGPYAGTAKIQLRSGFSSLNIRVPSWADRPAIETAARRVGLGLVWKKVYACLTGIQATKTYELPLVLKETPETFALNGRTIHLVWRGDEIAKMDGMHSFPPYFPAI